MCVSNLGPGASLDEQNLTDRQEMQFMVIHWMAGIAIDSLGLVYGECWSDLDLPQIGLELKGYTIREMGSIRKGEI